MQKQVRKGKRHHTHEDLIFVGDLTIRDVRFDKIFELHDRELKSALAAMERFLNDKLQADVTITMLAREVEVKPSKDARF